MAKSRVAPIKPVTISRLELTADSFSVKVDSILLEELAIIKITEWYWTDSKVDISATYPESYRTYEAMLVLSKTLPIKPHVVQQPMN